MASDPAAIPATPRDNATTVSRDSSDASPFPDNTSKKRKYEEATEDEKLALFKYHSENPNLKQRELADWFRTTYGKSINQSTVSRNLKKFKSGASPPKIPAEGSPAKSGYKRRTTQSPLQVSQQLPPKATLSAVSMPPTPPARDNRTVPIDAELCKYYAEFLQRNPKATTAESDRELKNAARRLLSTLRPPPPPEKIDDPVVDDAWVSNWKCVHGFPPMSPTSPASTSCFGSLSGDAPVRLPPLPPLSPNNRLAVPDVGRRPSEDSEPRSPVSTVSSVENMSNELPPMRTTPPLNLRNALTDRDRLSQVRGGPLSTENSRIREIEKLRRDIEDYERYVQDGMRKKEAAQRQLEKLQNMGSL